VFILKAKYELEWNLFMMEMLPSLCNNDKEAYELVRRTTWGFPEVIDLQDEKAIKKEIQDTEGAELIIEYEPTSFLQQAGWFSNLRAVSWRHWLDWLQRLG
jgi:hypothetical protein